MGGGILAGRLAGTEGAFFARRSKDAIGALKDKVGPIKNNPPLKIDDPIRQADVLPEVLRHTIPPSFGEENMSSVKEVDGQLSAPTSFGNVKFVDQSGSLAEFLPAVPGTTLGPKRWRLESQDFSAVASTANDARMRLQPRREMKDLNAAVQGYLAIVKAFTIATTVVFGGAFVAAVMIKSHLGINSLEDIHIKGKEVFQPRVQALQDWMDPMKRKVSQINHQRHEGKAYNPPFRSEFVEALREHLRR